MRILKGVILLVIGFALSCTDWDDEPETLPQKWQLYQIHSYMADETRFAEDEGIQEILQFQIDSTFILSRTAVGDTTESSGTFTLDTINGVPAFNVTFNTGGIFDCGTGKTVYEFRGTSLIDQNGVPCDGPEYRYIRIQE